MWSKQWPMLRSCRATAMELANKSKTMSKSGTIQAFIKDIFVQCVRPRRLVIFYLKCAAYKSTYILTYLLTYLLDETDEQMTTNICWCCCCCCRTSTFISESSWTSCSCQAPTNRRLTNCGPICVTCSVISSVRLFTFHNYDLVMSGYFKEFTFYQECCAIRENGFNE